MAKRQHVRVLVLHYFERGFTAAQACKEINAKEGKGQISVSNVYYWYKKFRSGNHSLLDRKRSGRPSIYDTKLAAKEVLKNPQMHSRSLAMHVGCLQSTAVRLLDKMDLIPKKPSIIPHVLSEADKKRRVAFCRDLLKKHNMGSFFHRIITCDEKWCLYDNPDHSMQWVKRSEKPHPVHRKNIHGKKSMLTVFWCVDGPILWKFVPQEKSIDADYVCQELEEMVLNAEQCGRKHARPSTLLSVYTHISENRTNWRNIKAKVVDVHVMFPRVNILYDRRREFDE
ncbi:transposase [Ancylostoma ceylanicum]|uniref:Transposase n=1 Tax=Ancylostoma ceylanicum TaxID=53326 RepID=A0A0D6LL67_9BILA|nr:transposase [Ancylostoma ceylanicum]